MIEEILKKIEVLFELEKYDEVKRICYKNIVGEETDIAFYTFLILALINTQNFKEALKVVDEALSKYPNDDYLIYLKAKILFAMVKNKEALNFIQKALSLKSNNKEYLHLLAKIYMAQKKFKKAKEAIDKALNIAPNDIEIQITYAVLLYGMDKDTESKKVFEQILETDPNNALALDFYSDFFGSVKDRKKTLKQLLFFNPFDKSYQEDLRFIDFYYKYIILGMFMTVLFIYFSRGSEMLQTVSNILFVIFALVGSFDVRVNFIFIVLVMLIKVGVNPHSFLDIVIFVINAGIVTWIYYIGYAILKTIYYKIKYEWIPRWKN